MIPIIWRNIVLHICITYPWTNPSYSFIKRFISFWISLGIKYALLTRQLNLRLIFHPWEKVMISPQRIFSSYLPSLPFLSFFFTSSGIFISCCWYFYCDFSPSNDIFPWFLYRHNICLFNYGNVFIIFKSMWIQNVWRHNLSEKISLALQNDGCLFQAINLSIMNKTTLKALPVGYWIC